MQRLNPASTQKLTNQLQNLLFRTSSSVNRASSLNRTLKLSTLNSVKCLSSFNVSKSGQFVLNTQNSGLIKTQRFYASASLPEHTKILLPALSPTMEQGTLAKWAKKRAIMSLKVI